MATETQNAEDLKNKYKDTIDLPQTTFPMRGNGPVREPEFQAKWEELQVYEKNLAARKNARPFILHDGPPYLSSDKIHIGTALNKTLKDIVTKYKAQKGFYTPYVPGYDSHGLPIENAVVKKIKGGRNAVSVAELRKKCEEFALKNLKGQEEKFKRLGAWGEWENPYVTLQPEYEAEQIRVFADMAKKGYIYRDLKTVYWSYGCETALADAEVEYNDEHVSNSIYAAFKTKPETVNESFKYADLLKESYVVIWTTTPWTIPGNLAIALNKDFNYGIYEIVTSVKDGVSDEDLAKALEKQSAVIANREKKILIAEELKEAIEKDFSTSTHKVELKLITETFKGSELEGLVTTHPLYDRESPILFGDHVTVDAGTGCVHTAPGHGQEDFIIGKEKGLDILCPVNSRGVYTDEAGSYEGIEFTGHHVIKDGNDLIMEALAKSGALLFRTKITHSYPYCWRSKTPLLYRATEQWFCSVDSFRKEALSEIDKVQWIPARGRNRIYSMVEDRGDWCISRQRTWGVPIPVFYDKTKVDEHGEYEPVLDFDLIEHLASVFAKEGTNSWYEKDVKDLLPANSKYKPEDLIKETDTMDVWFDSGSSHRTVVAAREVYGEKSKRLPVDLYLEGSDQHRGWFQSSLLTSVATNGMAPYKSVLTHGFVVDEKGKKMSKSLGNVVDPADVIKKYGADILRLWVASVDYSLDIKVGDAMFKQLSDIYRNLRNTSRYMLGNLNDFDPQTDYVAYDDLWELDKYLLHRLQDLTKEITLDFDKYEFFKYYQLLQNFCAVDLSAFYFDILKDRLYTHGTNSPSRRSAQTVLYELLSVVMRVFVPVLPHLAEDVYQNLPEKVKAGFKADKNFSADSSVDSILLSNWAEVNDKFVNTELAAKWEKILEVRESVNKEIEMIRADKKVGKSLEAQVSLTAPKETIDMLKSIESELEAIFIVSNVELKEGSELAVQASAHEGTKCVRCWKIFPDEQIKDGICPSCNEAINKWHKA